MNYREFHRNKSTDNAKQLASYKEGINYESSVPSAFVAAITTNAEGLKPNNYTITSHVFTLFCIADNSFRAGSYSFLI